MRMPPFVLADFLDTEFTTIHYMMERLPLTNGLSAGKIQYQDEWAIRV